MKPRKSRSELNEIFLSELHDEHLSENGFNIQYAIYIKEVEREYEENDKEYVISFYCDRFNSDDASIMDKITDNINKQWCSNWGIEEEGNYYLSWQVQSDHLHIFYKL